MPHRGMTVAPARSAHAGEAPERERTWMQNRDFGFGDFELVSRPTRRRAYPAPADRARPVPADHAAPTTADRGRPAPATHDRRAEEPAAGPRRPAPRPAAASARRVSGPVAEAARRPAEAVRPVPVTDAHPARRTITIQGRGSDRNWSPTAPSAARRPQRKAYDRAGYKPDRVALWAVLMGIVLLLAAATSAHAVVLHANHAALALLTR